MSGWGEQVQEPGSWESKPVEGEAWGDIADSPTEPVNHEPVDEGEK
jgi:hypothetical protein